MMKVVLLADFSNVEVRRHLHLKEASPLYKGLIRLFRLPQRVGEFSDHAQWIPSIISSIEEDDGFLLHVISPHIRLSRKEEVFEMRGVTYHFFKSEWSSFSRIIGHYGFWKLMQNGGSFVRRAVDEIRPDLVVLSGAENPVIAVSILSLTKYPRLCLCQTIYNNPKRQQYAHPKRLNQELEKEIFAKIPYFGVFSGLHYGLLKKYRPDATVFKYGYPSKGSLLEPSAEIQKQFDFVNFALMHGQRKGTHDSIQALAIVKKEWPNVSLNIVGGCDKGVFIELQNLIKELGLTENVVFTPFFEKKDDLMRHIQKARFAVLPCKLDHISGTMFQAMQLGLPLVVYKTTGTPSFNRKKECVLIATKDDVKDLASKMIILLESPLRAAKLRANAREFQVFRSQEAKENGRRLKLTFKAVVANACHHLPIPNELLFNPEVDD